MEKIMDKSRLLGVACAYLALFAVATVSTSSFASTCPVSPDPNIYNGYCLDGIRAGGFPYFDTGVDVTWDKKNNLLTGMFDNSGGDSFFHVSSSEQFTITSTKVEFSAIMNLLDDDTGTTGSIKIWGHIDDLSIDENPAPLLMSADLTGNWRQSGDMKLIGFNTMNIICHDDINTYLGGGGCTENESLYFDLDEAIDFNSLGKNGKGNVKTRTPGVAIATVPVPSAVWLFGSGLLGLVGIARRKKA